MSSTPAHRRGAAALPPPPEATIDSDVHPADSRGAWIELWLVETPLETIPSSDLDVRTEAPGGATSTAVCGEPGMRAGEGACETPFIDNAWGRGDGLWSPAARTVSPS